MNSNTVTPPNSPSEKAKALGLKNLSQVAEITGQSPQTLINWNKNKSELFNIVLLGCVSSLNQQQ